MKRQHSVWLENSDWDKLLLVIHENGFSGKGQLERFLETIAREHFIIIKGVGKLQISIL